MRILLVGLGDLGAAIAAEAHALGHTVVGLKRSPSDRISGVDEIVYADVTQPNTLIDLPPVRPDVVIYCVSATQYTDEGYYQAYVLGLRHVLTAFQQAQVALKHVFFISSTGVYGQTSNQRLDEECMPVPNGFSGERMLEAERVLANAGYAHTSLRLSGIYGPGRLRLIRMAKERSAWPAEIAWTNRIHRDDAAGFVAHLLQQLEDGTSIADCYLVTDNQPVGQHEVLAWLSAQMGLTQNVSDEVPILGGKPLSNARLRATGYQLRYPSYREGYAAVLASLDKA